jgi:hypothetical protein
MLASFRWSLRWMPVLALTLLGLVASLPPPPSGTDLLAVFPPWWSAPEVAGAAAGVGDILAAGRSHWAVVVRVSANDGGTRLRRAGAWLILDPGGLGICAPAPSSPQR